MLTILPSLLLILAAVVILILQRIRPGFGYAWIIGTVASLLAWGLTIAMHWINPAPLVIPGWVPLPDVVYSAALQWDVISWPYALALSTLALSILLTLSARLLPTSDTRIWARNLLVIGIGILSVLSTNPVTFALTWTAIDVVELTTVLGAVTSSRQKTEAVVAFGVRTAGTLSLIWAMILGSSQTTSLSFSFISPYAGLFLLLGAGLRLGVLPLNLPYQQEIPLRRGIATALRMVSSASSLVLLARLPQDAVPVEWQPFLLIFTILAALYGSAMWVTARDEIYGRSYWVISLAAFAVCCVIQGQPQSSISWGISLILGGSLLFLFNARSSKILWIPILMLVSVSGVPFSLNANGWMGLLGNPMNGNSLIFLLAFALILLGAVKHILPVGEPLKEKEQWVQTIYPVGLLILIIPTWLITAFDPLMKFQVGTWWAAPVVITLAAFSFLIFYRRGWRQPDEGKPNWVMTMIKRTGGALAAASSLTWLYRFFWWIYKQISSLFDLLTRILEGDGGVLWVFVLLALLIALINAGGY